MLSQCPSPHRLNAYITSFPDTIPLTPFLSEISPSPTYDILEMASIKERTLWIESALNPKEEALEMPSTWSDVGDARPKEIMFIDTDNGDYTQYFKKLQWALYESILEHEGEHGLRQLYSNGASLQEWLEFRMKVGTGDERTDQEGFESHSVKAVSESFSSFTQEVGRIGQQVDNSEKGGITGKKAEGSGTDSPKAGSASSFGLADRGASVQDTGDDIFDGDQSVSGSCALQDLQDFLKELPLGREEDDRDSFQLEMDRFYTEWVMENGEIEESGNQVAGQPYDKGENVTEDQVAVTLS